jgi:DNA adenine methylase
MNNDALKAPFVWFGGKRKVAAQVWAALGDVDNYVEPFLGSGAVLLGRPHNLNDGSRRAETVNDADGFVSNFWRAVAGDPEAVARYASDPVNEVDLFARHLWLVNTGRSRLLEGLESDPDWFDAKVAGWWVWGVNAWIGSGWCSGNGPWRLGDAGQGVNRKLPHLGTAGQGVNRQLPHLGTAGQAGYNNLDIRTRGIANYMMELADRYANIRVCNGDWSRVVTNGALSFGATVGIFLDPPYLGDVRTADLYAVDDHNIANEVRDWCLAIETNPRYRIVLAGYRTEHDHLMPATWRRIHWKAGASYATSTSAAKAAAGATDSNLTNRHNECLWLSPACLNSEPTLFDWNNP